MPKAVTRIKLKIKKIFRKRLANGEIRVLRFGFKSKNQLPLFLVWHEFWYNNEIVFASVLFKI
jgi:hypothetical protein